MVRAEDAAEAIPTLDAVHGLIVGLAIDQSAMQVEHRVRCHDCADLAKQTVAERHLLNRHPSGGVTMACRSAEIWNTTG